MTTSTATVVQSALGLATSYPGATGLIAAQTYRHLQAITVQELLRGLDERNVSYSYNRTTHTCVLNAFNSRILFGTLDNPAGLSGMDFAWLVVDGEADSAALTRLWSNTHISRMI